MGLNEPLLSIIVPVYNVEDYLEECVHSLLHQTYQNTEIILVDDGSTDNSGKMCDTIASGNKGVTVYHKQNGGLSSARNYGIEHANGAYLGFVDSDDFIDAQMYEILMRELLNNEADVAECNYYKYYSADKFAARTIPEQTNSLFLDLDAKIRLFEEFSAWNKVYKRELFAQIRYPEGKLYEDARTMYKIAHKVEKLVIVPEPLYYYRQRNTSIMGTFSFDNYLDRVSVWTEIYEFEKTKFPQKELDAIIQRRNSLILELLRTMFKNQHLKIDKPLAKQLVDMLEHPNFKNAKEKCFVKFIRLYTKNVRRNEK